MTLKNKEVTYNPKIKFSKKQLDEIKKTGKLTIKAKFATFKDLKKLLFNKKLYDN
jgi:hypothetical protein